MEGGRRAVCAGDGNSKEGATLACTIGFRFFAFQEFLAAQGLPAALGTRSPTRLRRGQRLEFRLSATQPRQHS